jgi:predicted  nucleic acid-binding Zn-ribbon protein
MKEKDAQINGMEIRIKHLEDDLKVSKAESKSMYSLLNGEIFYWKSMTVSLRKEKAEAEVRFKQNLDNSQSKLSILCDHIGDLKTRFNLGGL